MLQPTRHKDSKSYRYGFQGQEKDDEIKGEGNSVNYKYRMHDPRIGRFFAVDPLTKDYPHYTPYSFSGNKVVAYIELEGMEELIYTKSFKNYGDHVKCSISSSEHLEKIMKSVSDPNKAVHVKVYLAEDNGFFTGEHGYTGNLVALAKHVLSYEKKHAANIDDINWMTDQLNNLDDKYEKYLEYREFFDYNEVSPEGLISNSKADPNFRAYLIMLKSYNLDSTSSAMKTFFHEIQQHLQETLGVRNNPDGKTTGASDHKWGHSYDENKKHYNDNGYTDESVAKGFSPRKEIIVKDSPAGKTNSEIDKVYYE